MMDVIKSEQSERSPARKRSRLDPTINNVFKERDNLKLQQWSIQNRDIVLDNMDDDGVAKLDNDPCDEDKYPNFLDLSLAATNNIRANKEKEISRLLHSTLSKETLQKISSDEWDEFVICKPKREFIFKIDHFQQLSDEMILQIFHWLPKCSLANAALVCVRWHQLAQDESLWTRMDVSSRYLEPGALGHILSRQSLIVRLTHSEICVPPILPGVKASLPEFRARLLYLDLSMAHILPDSMTSIFEKCYRLKKLSLENLTVNDEVMKALSRSKDLEVLNLALVEGLRRDGLSYLFTNCKKLRELNIAWTYLNSTCVHYVCINLPSSIDRLNISGCRKLLYNDNVLDLVKNCPNLRELDLSDCTAISDGAILHILKLEELNFLALSRCYSITCRSLLQLKMINSLMYLDIHGGHIRNSELELLHSTLGPNVNINKFKFSSVARPTVGPRRSSIWGLRVRD